MKPSPIFFMLGVPTLLFALTASANDPKETTKDAEQKPDCTAMKDMDHSAMDMNDPAMQALMEKCMNAMHSANMQGNDAATMSAHENTVPEKKAHKKKKHVHKK